MKRNFTKPIWSLLLGLIVVAAVPLQSCTKDEPMPQIDLKPDPISLEGREDLFAKQWPEENDVIKYVDPEGVSYSKTIYVNAESGSDANDGFSETKALSTLAKAQTLINAEDASASVKLLLYGSKSTNGTIYNGALSLENRTAATHVGSYGEAKARINAAGYRAGVYIKDGENITITDLKITANGGSKTGCSNRCGVEIEGNNNANIEINNVDMRDIFYYNYDDTDIPSNRNASEWAEADDFNYGWGIRVKGRIDNLSVIDCNVRNVSQIGYKMNSYSKGITNLVIKGSTSYETGGAGAQFSHVKGAVMSECKSVNSGSRKDPRHWGRGSGMWLVHSEDFTFERNLYEGAEGIGDSCGAHIDIDNKDIVIQYCLSRNNAGGFVEVLGRSYNCAYRYNISINDGWRNPNDRMQFPHWGWLPSNVSGVNGCLVTINGTNSGDRWTGPFHTYVYNNTIINTGFDSRGYKNPLTFEIATSVQGVMMVNNLFWIPERMHGGGGSHRVENGQLYDEAYDFRVSTGITANGSAQVRDMTKEEIDALDIQVKNNLYMLKDALPLISSNKITPSYWDEKPIVADPYLGNEMAWEAEDAIPRNAEVINQGIEISKLLSDQTEDGIEGGLLMDVDFFGKPLSSPIIGACVVQ